MKSACVLLAPGCEEMEAVIVIDVLRRAGVDVTAAGLRPGVFSASRDVKLASDVALEELETAKDFDLLVTPGGMPGTEALRDDPRVRDLLVHYLGRADKWVGSICASPLALDAHGLLDGRRFTCYPAVAEKIGGGIYTGERVEVDGHLVTSQGPGTAMEFALKLVELLAGRDTRDEVAEGMLYRR